MAVIQWLQASMAGPFWETFWYLASKIYSEEVMLVLLPVIFWVGDRSFARFFATLYLVQIWLNVLLKGLFHTPRPAAAGIRVTLLDTEGGFSLPSGHAQGSAAIFVALAGRIRRTWFTALAVLAILLVGVARLYLGLHWPVDVLAGWAGGLVLALGAAATWPVIAGLTGRIPFGVRLGLGLTLPVLMLGLWERLPFVAVVGLGNLYPGLGALAGIWCGTLLEEWYLGYDPRGPLGRQVVKCVLGLAVLLAVRMGLKALLPPGDWSTFVRYAAMGLMVTPVLPWLFGFLPGDRAQRRRAA